MKTCFTIFMLFFCVGLHAQQQETLQYDSNSTYIRMSERVTTEMLIGKWQNAAMPRQTIEIKIDNGQVFLQGRDQFSEYHFIRLDSLHVRAVASLMRWPPAYCYVAEADGNKLELEFTGVAGQNPIRYIYKRQRP